MKSYTRHPLNNERGLTLIEVLGAITIMAVISVTIIGYFISAMERSEDQSKRVIATNLTRLKAAEFREVAKVKTVTSTNFDDLEAKVTGMTMFKRSNKDTLPVPFRSLLEPTIINNTEYNYEVTLGSASAVDHYLIHMLVRVSWGSSVASSTQLDTYVVKRW